MSSSPYSQTTAWIQKAIKWRCSTAGDTCSSELLIQKKDGMALPPKAQNLSKRKCTSIESSTKTWTETAITKWDTYPWSGNHPTSKKRKPPFRNRREVFYFKPISNQL